MTITYHSGRRIQATQADFDGTPALSGGWKELGRVTASVGEVTGLADKRYLMVLGHHIQGSGNSGLGLQLNGDTTASQYPRRYSENGGSDATPTTETNVFFDTNGSTVSGKEWFTVMHIENKSDKEKLGIYHTAYNRNGLGSGQSSHRLEGVFKWVNTSNPISSIKFSDFNGTAMNSASQVIVLGWDPADTHTDNFWEELASVELSSAGDVLSSGTITAKKYLWVQFYVKKSGSIVPEVSFNNTTGNEYAYRFSDNGAPDGTPQLNKSAFRTSTDDTNSFVNMFIINNSSNEKLAIVNSSDVATTGAGNAPTRREIVAKWTNTSSQITEIDVDNVSSGNFDTGSFIKVWGSN